MKLDMTVQCIPNCSVVDHQFSFFIAICYYYLPPGLKTAMIENLCTRLLDISSTTIPCKLFYVNEIADSLQCVKARNVEDKKGMRASDGRSPADT